jgi:ABC-type hemin transport system ATPase subunit
MAAGRKGRGSGNTSFVQQLEGGLHQYVGKFEVRDYDSHKKQIDSTGRQRNVILFRLGLLD